MKKVLLFVVSALSICLLQRVSGQGTMFVSTLGETPVGSATIGSDAWIAQSFITGTNVGGYALTSIQLLMNAATAIPSGFSVSVYDKTGDPHIFNSRDLPQNLLGNLAGPDPATGGLFTYSVSSLDLMPSTWYFVVATAASPVTQAAYNWSAASGEIGVVGPGDRWMLNNAYFSSANGSSWTLVQRQYVFQLAINGTAVPEPSAFVFCAMAFGFWLLRRPRCQHRK